MAGGKHTPSPWVSQGWTPTWAYIPVTDANHNLVCSMYPNEGRRYSRDQVKANALLVAAGPDLLAACQQMLAQVEHWQADVAGNLAPLESSLSKAREDLIAVIAAATAA